MFKRTYPLPLRYPTFLRIHHGDDTVDIQATRLKIKGRSSSMETLWIIVNINAYPSKEELVHS